MPNRTETIPQGAVEKRPYEDWFYWLQPIMGAVLFIVLIFTFAGRLARVDGDSMNPTLEDGELMLVWSLGYQPKAGDIVILNKTTSEALEGEAIVKRIIATAGQTVDIDYVSGTVYVNGVPLEEEYILEELYRPGNPYYQQTHFEVPEDSVFVLGDNRNNSKDSRHSGVGCIHQGYLLGRAAVVIWPLSHIRIL